MGGSEQFLGRQLAEQAIQLALLVEKMNEMVIKQEQSIDKYFVSDINGPIKKTLTGTGVSGNTVGIKVFGSGSIAIKARYTNISTTTAYYITVIVNGTTQKSITVPKNVTNYELLITDILVKELDEIKLNGYSDTIFISGSVHYNLIPKPEIV